MTFVHDRRRGGEPATAEVEDAVSAEVLSASGADREYLARVLREPHKFLPPPRSKPRRAPQPPREPESRLASGAKFVGLLVAGGLLTGAVVASALLAGRHDGQGRAEEPAPPEITGVAALGGFATPDRSAPASGGGHGDKGSGSHETSQPKRQRTAPAAPDTTGGTSTPSGAPGTSATTAAAGAMKAGSASKAEVVRSFYRLVANAPRQALSLLDPVLAGDQAENLVDAWAGMDDIEVTQVTQRADGAVLAVVTMADPDGGHLRITQLLKLTDPIRNLITGVTLLSAEHVQ
ncbi:hypothetical protein [Amycolatopsis minnesotensis]|uniref:Mce-associated membrane protein n=1 Tax=Amycolatopsis minnesotensis TaxID=337894 RepID=A0ABN2Q8T0_9PSEU